MADPILHIKDSYFFEVPKFAWQYHYRSRSEFPDVWVRLDPDFQRWEADRLYEELVKLAEAAQASGTELRLPERAELMAEYEHFLHAANEKGEHENTGKPLDVYLEESFQQAKSEYAQWKKADPDRLDKSFGTFVAEHPIENEWFAYLMLQDGMDQRWEAAKSRAGNVQEYKTNPRIPEWSKEKIAAYNHNLSGKILIPQPFGTLRNLHEREAGITISKYMVIEVLVAILLFLIFRWLAVRVKTGERPRGRLWNLLESFLVFIRDQVARPAIGHHDGDRFVPLLWTIFMFILTCNLFGMIPGFGAPTSVFGVTLAMALVTFGTVLISGMLRFGPIGFFKNQVPHMDLPLPMAILIKPMVFVIEIVGLLIRHLVLSIRLLANMVAGHLVILGIMGVAFGATAAVQWASLPTWQWSIAAVIAILGSTLISCLELFVAFLQAYIFTFLSALFIGAAIHHH